MGDEANTKLIYRETTRWASMIVVSSRVADSGRSHLMGDS